MPSIFDKWLKRAPNQPGAESAAPASFEELFAQGQSAAARGELARAESLYDHALSLDPSRVEGYYKRANARKDSGQLRAALADYDAAIELNPHHAHALCNRGWVLFALGDAQAAVSSYDAALTVDPADTIALYNRALALQQLERWDEALASYDRALLIDPEYADARYNRALLALYGGDFARGWRDYEWRWKNATRLRIGTPRHFAQPAWRGEQPLPGKTLLLYAEAGLGDTIQFCRYASECARLGASVVLEVQPPLTALLRNLPGVAQIVPSGSALPPFDYQCPLMSLPLAFNTRLESVPAPARYLAAPPQALKRWRQVLGEGRRPRVGLVWSGNPDNSIDARRSVALADWLPYLPPHFDYFRLQTQLRDVDRETLGATRLITSFEDRDLDFENTAALCELMDVVLTVDTSLAHLAGALGRRTWTLLPRIPDWRWLRERTDTPWYPSMTLYRQDSASDWQPVFARIEAALHGKFP